MISDAFLQAIDLLVNEGKVTYCAVRHPEQDLLNEALRAEGWESYCDPAVLGTFRVRRPYERSLWLRKADNRCAPELYVLAAMKFGKGILDAEPYWADKDWTNNVMENVALPEPVVPQERQSKYGVKAGTPEYRKAYSADPDNKARQRAASRKHATERREAIRRAKIDNADALEELRKRILGPDRRRGEDDDGRLT